MFPDLLRKCHGASTVLARFINVVFALDIDDKIDALFCIEITTIKCIEYNFQIWCSTKHKKDIVPCASTIWAVLINVGFLTDVRRASWPSA
jgi:hypothetical protein